MNSIVIQGIYTPRDYLYFTWRMLLTNKLFYLIFGVMVIATLFWFPSWFLAEETRDFSQVIQIALAYVFFFFMVFVMPAIRIKKTFKTTAAYRRAVTFTFQATELVISNGDLSETLKSSECVRLLESKNYLYLYFKFPQNRPKLLPRRFFDKTDQIKQLKERVQGWQKAQQESH